MTIARLFRPARGAGRKAAARTDAEGGMNGFPHFPADGGDAASRLSGLSAGGFPRQAA